MQMIYYGIYEDLRDKIINGTFAYQTYMPSESTLTKTWSTIEILWIKRA